MKNKASDIKLVYLYSTMKMMHGPINIKKKKLKSSAFPNLFCFVLVEYLFSPGWCLLSQRCRSVKSRVTGKLTEV